MKMQMKEKVMTYVQCYIKFRAGDSTLNCCFSISHTARIQILFLGTSNNIQPAYSVVPVILLRICVYRFCFSRFLQMHLNRESS